MVNVIYVRGGDKHAPDIAEKSGMEYGIRHDYKAYAPVFMLDIDFHSYEHLPANKKRAFWQGYKTRAQELRPFVGMAADYFSPDDSDLLSEQLSDLEALSIPVIMVCPKFHGAVADIPRDYVIAVSMPAPSYASFLPDYRTLNGRVVHLLGGKPEVQVEIGRKILGAGGSIVSVDGSYHAMKAAHGQWFDGGVWHQMRSKSVLTVDLSIASGINIVRYIRRGLTDSQLALDF